MTRATYIEKAQALGYSQEEIAETLALHDEITKGGLKDNLEVYLVEKPIDD